MRLRVYYVSHAHGMFNLIAMVIVIHFRIAKNVCTVADAVQKENSKSFTWTSAYRQYDSIHSHMHTQKRLIFWGHIIPNWKKAHRTGWVGAGLLRRSTNFLVQLFFCSGKIQIEKPLLSRSRLVFAMESRGKRWIVFFLCWNEKISATVSRVNELYGKQKPIVF